MPVIKPAAKKNWNAEKYHQNSSIQLESSKKILKEISFRGNEDILDIGCGDGKITAIISSCIPNGRILGIDLSPEMILFAKNKFCPPHYMNISFLIQDGAKIKFKNEFDVIFSSFALHWIIDFDSFIKRINKALKDNGKIVFTIPLGISSPLEQATAESIKNPTWAEFFTEFVEPWRFLNAFQYEKMILDAGFELTSLEVISHKKIFDSRSSFENYVIQWYPYLNYIDAELKEKFFKEIIDRYLEIEPCSSLSTINFEFSRIDIIAHKR